MMAWVASVVWVMWQTICGVVTDVVRKENGCGGIVARLHLQAVPVDGAAVEAGRRAGLEAPHAQPQAVEPRREAKRRRLVDAACGDLALADMDQAAQEGAGGEHHGAGPRGCGHRR